MKVLVASSVCWTIATSWRISPCASAGSLRDEPLHDLGLEDDVGEALGRAVVHRPGDLAAQVLLAPRTTVRQPAARPLRRPPGSRTRCSAAPMLTRDASGSRPPAASAYAAEGLAVARQRPALALEDLDLRLHQGGALGERDQLDVELGRAPSGPRVLSVQSRSSLSAAATARDSWRAASVFACVTSRSISPSSRSRRATSSASLAVSSARLAGAVGGAVAVRRSSSRVRGRRWGRDGDQSSGIRIQPWRIAYTTAWVRSFTDSLRRIELMWFLTVCSLIDSA